MKSSQLSRSLLLIICGMLLAVACYAGPIALPVNSWQTEPFTEMNSGDFFPVTYRATFSGTLSVTGYYVTGDYYGVYINETLVGTTTQVFPTDVDYGDGFPSLYTDPASAYASGLFSTGQFSINAGDWITVSDLYPPSGIGEVGLYATAPEPATFGLIGIALIGGILIRRKRQHQVRQLS